MRLEAIARLRRGHDARARLAPLARQVTTRLSSAAAQDQRIRTITKTKQTTKPSAAPHNACTHPRVLSSVGPWTSTTMLDHAWMMVTVRVADSGRAAPPSRGGVNNARRRRKFCEGRGEMAISLRKKGGESRIPQSGLQLALQRSAADFLPMLHAPLSLLLLLLVLQLHS